MLEVVFIRIFSMSLTAGIMVLAVSLVRLCFKRAPKIFSYCLWAVVLFRLICPVSFEAGFSLLGIVPQAGGSGQMAGELLGQVNLGDNITNWQPDMQGGAGEEGGEKSGPSGILENSGGKAQTEQATGVASPAEAEGLKGLQEAIHTGAWIWIAGMLVMAVYSVATLWGFKRQLRNARLEKENIYIMEQMCTPFVIGMIRPKIYLPEALMPKEKEYILLHERTHIRRGDHIVKIISYLVLCIHWFNPLVWLAFFLSGKDMEMSCDEAVLEKLGKGIRTEYSSSLLSLATGRRIVSGVPLAFGEGDTGSRIKNVLAYKKPALVIAILLAVVCAAVSAVLLANPKQEKADGAVGEENQASEIYYGVVTELEAEENEGSPRLVLNVLGVGAVDIPEAENLTVSFKREEQQLFSSQLLLAGDLVELKFPQGERVEIQETYPAQFSVKPESMTVKWSGMKLGAEENGRYRFTFPAAMVPDWEKAVEGDLLLITWKETQGKKAETKETAILFLGESEEGAVTFTVSLEADMLQKLFADLGSNASFALQGTDNVGEQVLRYADVDRIQIVTSMGNPQYGAEGKVITDEETLKQFVDLFNSAEVEDKLMSEEDLRIAMPSRYKLYQGERLVKEFVFNGNDTGILWVDGGYRAVSYPEFLPNPYELYQKAEGKEVMVYDDRQVEQIGYEEYRWAYEGYLDEVNIKGSIGEDGNPAVCVAERYDYDKDGTWDRLYRKMLPDGKAIELHFGDGTVLTLTETQDYWQSEIPYAYDVTGDGINEIVYVGQHEGSTDPLAESEIVVYQKVNGSYRPLRILDDVALNPEFEDSKVIPRDFKGICYFFYAGEYDADTRKLVVKRDENSQVFSDFRTEIELKPEEAEYIMPWQEESALGGAAYTLSWLEYDGESFMAAYIRLGGKWGCHDVTVLLQYDEEKDALVCKDMIL